MGTPLLCADNLFNPRIYTGHAITASAELTGFEVHHLHNMRRDDQDYWTTTADNVDAWAKSTADRIRGANVVAIDRGHNLAGKTIRLQCSNDDFSTVETVVDITMPSVMAPGHIDDALGVRTEEGAWIKRFPLRAAKYWRLFVPAVASFRPRVVNLFVGLAFAPEGFDRPDDPDAHELVAQESESEAGYIGRATATRRRRGTLRYGFVRQAEYHDEARYHLNGLFGDGRPTWIVHDVDRAENAVLAVRDRDVLGFPVPPDSPYEHTMLNWVEHEAKAA